MHAARLEPVSGGQDISAEAVPADFAPLLGAAPDERYLVVRRTSFGADGALVEYVVSYLDPSDFSIHVEFGGSPRV